MAGGKEGTWLVGRGRCGRRGHSESRVGCLGLIQPRPAWAAFWWEGSGPTGITSLPGLGCPGHAWPTGPLPCSLSHSSSASFVSLSGFQTRGNLARCLEWNIEAGERQLVFSGWMPILGWPQAGLEVLAGDCEQDLGHDLG